MLNFFDIIQAYFTQVTGRFIMFSGRDVVLLYEWRDQGATAASICRGVRDAVRVFDRNDPPRSIYNCKKFIEPYVERARARLLVGVQQGVWQADTEENVALRALQILERAGQKCEDEARKVLYRETWYKVRGLVDEINIDTQYAGLLVLEEEIADGAFLLLDDEGRHEVEDRVLAEARTLKMSMSEDAWRRHMLARRRHMMVTHYDVVSLIP